MNNSIDLSHKADLQYLASILTDIQDAASDLELMLIGAAARDIQLTHAHGIKIERKTRDFDLAFTTPDWDTFNRLRQNLLASGKFTEDKSLHKLHHNGPGKCEIDVIPFGGVQNETGEIAWPPQDVIVMNVIGFREAHESATLVTLPGRVMVKVASLPGIILLKIAAWRDRRLLPPVGKDAADIRTLFREYINAGNVDRAIEHAAHFFAGDRDRFEEASAWLLGIDAGALLATTGADPKTRQYFQEIIRQEVEAGVTSALVSDMRSISPETDLSCLEQFWDGIQTASR